MDCEKFEANLLDLLYGELDELTSAGARRHASGCERCAAMLSGLQATREAAVLQMVAPPPDLEEKIFAAAREAEKVVPIRSRAGRVVSWAADWAMRPQTAMAALFMLAIGSSFIFLRRDASSPVSVRVRAEGAPAAAAVAPGAAEARLDESTGAAAHGTLESARGGAALAPSPPSAASPAATSASAATRKAEMATGDLAPQQLDRSEEAKSAANSAPAAAPQSQAAAEARAMRAQGASGSAFAAPDSVGKTAAPADPQADFSSGMSAYRSRRFDEATRIFDALSSADANAALWAARSVREGRGCEAAVSRFDQVSGRAGGSTAGYEATLDAGRCYREIGNSTLARARLSKLLSVPAYADRAQTELDAATPQSAARKAAPAPRVAAPAADGY